MQSVSAVFAFVKMIPREFLTQELRIVETANFTSAFYAFRNIYCLGSVRFVYALQGWIYLVRNTVILWDIITIQNKCFLFEYILKVIYSCDGKAELPATIILVFLI